MRELYTEITTEAHIERCPVCGGAPALWRFAVSETSPATKAVMCNASERIGPQDGIASEGCLLYMPPDDFYRATEREAVRYWNEFAKALAALQRKNRWATAQVIRAQAKEGGAV